MTKSTKTVSASKASAPAKKVAPATKPVAKSTKVVEKKQPVKTGPAPVAEVGKDEAPKTNKMMTATIIFDRLTKAGKARKDIILSFMTDAGLSKAGASTYYQTIKNKK